MTQGDRVLRSIGLAVGWLLTLPGLLVLLAVLVYGTPVNELLGCRTAGIMTIRCSLPLLGDIAEFAWIVTIIAASFIPVSAIAILYAVGFIAWRWIRRRRAA